jgi:hypothetical protein
MITMLCARDSAACTGPVVEMVAVCEFALHLSDLPVCETHRDDQACRPCWDAFRLVVRLIPVAR